MRTFYLLLALFAAATPAMADECDARAADLVRATGATVDRKSTMKIFLKLGGFREFAVECTPALGVDVGVTTGLPPDAFFDFVAQAAHIVTGLPAAAVKVGAILCHKSALRSGDDMSDLDFQGAQFACQSFTRNGGATSITVFKMK
jgi:hypothetical protein